MITAEPRKVEVKGRTRKDDRPDAIEKASGSDGKGA